MRIDARAPGFVPGWWVWHAEHCEMLRAVVWVDDDRNQYHEHILPICITDDGVAGRTVQARKIAIYVDRKLVIINPVDDSEPLQTAEPVKAIGTPT